MKRVSAAIALIALSACSSHNVHDNADSDFAANDVPELVGSDSSDAPPPTDTVPPDTSAANTAPAPENADQLPPQDTLAGTPPADAPPADAAPPVADAAPVDAPPPADAPPAADSAPPAADTAPEAPVADNSSLQGSTADAPPEAAPAADSGSPVAYKVKRGDTLMKIAYEQYGDLYRWREILEANRDVVKNPNYVPPGTHLKLDGAGMTVVEHNGQKYMIKTGDTLGTISGDVYGTPRRWKKLWENNRQLIKDPNKIYAGFYLYYVPMHKLTGTDTEQEPTAANTATTPSTTIQ